MATDNRKFVQLQIEALAIRHFIVLYDDLEARIKTIFAQNIELLSSENRELLYFAFAGIKSNTISFEIDSASFSSAKVKYIKDETFSIFTVNQIIKLQRKYGLLSKLDFNIPSLNSKTTEYPFADCVIKLVNMRNKLAHEISHLSFKDSDIIEIVSNDCINKNSGTWFDTLDVTLMSDESKSIFSNILIMNNMLSELRKRENNNETVDT